MEEKKTSSALRRYVRLAYAQPAATQRKHRSESLPGPLFDATAFGLFVVFGILYLVR